MPGRLSHPRSARLLKGREFKAVFDQRRAISSPLFKVHYADSDVPRLGMAVSRRVSLRAVERNRIRRHIRESFRLMRPRLAPLDFVVLAKPAASGSDSRELRRALDQFWHRFSG